MGKRVNYFDRQFLRAEDFQVEQAYHLGRRRGVSAGVFRPGVAAGLDVVRIDVGSVRVTAGFAIDRLGREIVLDEDSGVIPVDPAAAVEIWISYAEAPTDPVSYLGANEQRSTRTDETPAIVPVPPGNAPADGLRLAIVPPEGGDPDMSGRPAAGPRDRTVEDTSLADAAVSERTLADDAVTSRVLTKAVPDSADQDTNSGTGVKTGHLADEAVTEPKLARNAVSDRVLRDGVVSSNKLRIECVAVGEVTVNPAQPERVLFDKVPPGEAAFYFINLNAGPTTFTTHEILWKHLTEFFSDGGDTGYGIYIENNQPSPVNVQWVVFRLI